MSEREERAKKVKTQRICLVILAILVLVAIIIGVKSCGSKSDNSETAKVTTKKETTKETTTKKPKDVNAVIIGECYVEDFKNYCKDLLPKKTHYIYKIGVLTGALLDDAFIDYGGTSVTAIERAAMYKPNQAFFLVGMNETENDTPEITVKHFDKMRKLLKKVNPDVDVVICSLPPVAKDGLDGYGTNAQISNYNEKIKEYCDKTDGVDYLNIRDVLEDENGRLKKEADPGDGAHWQVSAAKDVAKIIKKKSDELASK